MNSEQQAEAKESLENWLNKQTGKVVAAEKNSLAAIQVTKDLLEKFNELQERQVRLEGELVQVRQENAQLKGQVIGMIGTVGRTG